MLSLDPSVRLRPIDGWVVPSPIVPEPIPVPELITIALTQRPELRERQAAIRAALFDLQNAKVLPFSPNVILGYSTGAFGGGSDLATQTTGQPHFTNLTDRQDFDAIVYWSVRNLGVGNLAQIRLAQSNVRQNELRNIEVLDRIRAEVVLAFARTHVRYAQIESNECGPGQPESLRAGLSANQEWSRIADRGSRQSPPSAPQPVCLPRRDHRLQSRLISICMSCLANPRRTPWPVRFPVCWRRCHRSNGSLVSRPRKQRRPEKCKRRKKLAGRASDGGS